ncbi:MAG TPA: 4Fe-4S binding protein [Selenomonadales bacterium]|nr:4Fe-4S binding protein [Selenomonadales bacterium]
MLVNQEKCIGCGICIPYCPAQAISITGRKAAIDQAECLECGNCLRRDVVPCPTGAFYEKEGIYEEPRGIRRFFSDPTTTHAVTQVPGRGTEEVKTNDVTGRVCRGEIGVAVEMGRPCMGTDMAEFEKMTMALAKIGVVFEEANPLTQLLADKSTGVIDPKYKNEKLVSAIIEFTAPIDQMPLIMATVTEVAKSLNTVFSLDLIGCFEEDGSLPVLPMLEAIGLKPRVNSKVNLGMGRPYRIIRQ